MLEHRIGITIVAILMITLGQAFKELSRGTEDSFKIFVYYGNW